MNEKDCVFLADQKGFDVHPLTDTKAPKPKRLTWGFAMRLIFTAGIFVYLWYSIEWNKMLSLLRESLMVWWLAAMGLYLFTTLLGAVRWQILLNTCRAGVPFARTAQMTMIGLFANSFMPSAMGGDLVKAFYIAKEVPHQKATVIMSIFMERLLGLVAMFMISAFLIFSRFEALTVEPATRAAVYLYLAVFFMVFVAVAASRSERLIAWLTSQKWLPYPHIFKEAGESYRYFLTHPGCFFGGLAVSLLAQSSLICLFYAVSRALRMGLDFWDLASVLPLVFLVTLIPVTPNGIGLREVAFKHFLVFAGMTEESSVALSLGGFFVMLLFNLAGGLVYLQYRGYHPKPLPEPISEVAEIVEDDDLEDKKSASTDEVKSNHSEASQT